ncbi:hypothetical protein IFR05_003084 [Cadophora sp. M221]|nr:hypothetical protein IFR05_003084 [Cadophora sp. M221]
MHYQSFILYLFGFLAVTRSVAAKNAFNANFPKSFSFIETTQIFWGDGQGTDIVSLLVVGDTNVTERYSLPLDPLLCKKATIVDKITNCITWLNNGTANFGGDYARQLIANQQYHLVLNFVLQSDSSIDFSQSPVFQMQNPVISPSSSKFYSQPPTSKSSSTQPQPTVSTLASATSSTPSTSPSTSTSSARTTAAKTPNTSSTPTSTPTPSTSSTPKTGLTPGAKAGITIGVISLAAIAFLAIFFLYRKRQAKKEVPTTGQPTNRNTAINLDDISITLGSPVSYDRVYSGRQGWHQRDFPPLVVPRTPERRGQSREELHGSPF